MKFTYYYEETSQNTNCWVIKSEDMLTENEIMELSMEVGSEGETSSGDTYKVTFIGTEYGDNTDIEITGDDLKEED